MTLDELMADPPKPHKGGTHVYRVVDGVVEHLDRHLSPGMRTLETGCGLSTALFALRGTSHTCVVPFADEVAALRAWGERTGTPMAGVRFEVGRSEKVLPGLDASPLDLVLIDGAHTFPGPFLDWYYTADRLRVGGQLMVDDIQIWTGKVLTDFLDAEPEWKLVERIEGRTAVFEKLAEGSLEKWWGQQPYVVQQSRVTIRLGQLRRAGHFLRQGQLGLLRDKLLAELGRD